MTGCLGQMFGQTSKARRERFRRAWLRWPVPFAAMLLLSACVNEQHESQIGEQVARQVNAQVPLVRDRALNHFVQVIGARIARESDRPKVSYRFYIINSPVVNAFALPGGHIYVTRGLLERTRSVAELSAVLAHEIGHVAARHGAKKIQREYRTGSLVSVLYKLILRGEPTLLDQDALRIGEKLWDAQNSRTAEIEADELAVEYLVRSGVDPHGMVRLLQGLLEEERQNPGQITQWFSTHPMTANRISVVEKEIRKTEAAADDDLLLDLPVYSAFLRRVADLPGGSIPTAAP